MNVPLCTGLVRHMLGWGPERSLVQPGAVTLKPAPAGSFEIHSRLTVPWIFADVVVITQKKLTNSPIIPSSLAFEWSKILPLKWIFKGVIILELLGIFFQRMKSERL